MKNLNTKILIGGTSIEEDSEDLVSKKPHIAVSCLVSTRYVDATNYRQCA